MPGKHPPQDPDDDQPAVKVGEKVAVPKRQNKRKQLAHKNDHRRTDATNQQGRRRTDHRARSSKARGRSRLRRRHHSNNGHNHQKSVNERYLGHMSAGEAERHLREEANDPFIIYSEHPTPHEARNLCLAYWDGDQVQHTRIRKKISSSVKSECQGFHLQNDRQLTFCSLEAMNQHYAILGFAHLSTKDPATNNECLCASRTLVVTQLLPQVTCPGRGQRRLRSPTRNREAGYVDVNALPQHRHPPKRQHDRHRGVKTDVAAKTALTHETNDGNDGQDDSTLVEPGEQKHVVSPPNRSPPGSKKTTTSGSGYHLDIIHPESDSESMTGDSQTEEAAETHGNGGGAQKAPEGEHKTKSASDPSKNIA